MTTYVELQLPSLVTAASGDDGRAPASLEEKSRTDTQRRYTVLGVPTGYPMMITVTVREDKITVTNADGEPIKQDFLKVKTMIEPSFKVYDGVDNTAPLLFTGVARNVREVWLPLTPGMDAMFEDFFEVKAEELLYQVVSTAIVKPHSSWFTGVPALGGLA